MLLRSIKDKFNFLIGGESLTERSIHGVFWSAISKNLFRLLGLARTVVLARLLAPEDFGLFGIVLLSLSALETISRPGFELALIQKKENSDKHLNTAWTIQLIRGLALALVLFFSASLIANFFDEPKARILVQVLAISQLFRGIRNIGIIYFKKELDIHKQLLYELTGALSNTTVAIFVAVLLRNVWALVFGNLSSGLVLLIMSYVLHPYRPKLEINYRRLKGLYSFGLWVQANSLLFFVTSKGDDAFLGKVMGTTSLGLYQMAFRISCFIGRIFSKVIGVVIFPALSKLQDNMPKFREGFLKMFELEFSLILPMSVGMAILAPHLVDVLLTEKWMSIVPALRLLCVSSFINYSTRGSPLAALGKPNLLLYRNLIRVGIIFATIYPLTVHFGIVGTAMAVVLGWIVSLPFWIYYSVKLIKIRASQWLTRLLPSIAGTCIMSLGIFILKSAMSKIGLAELTTLVLFGVISYLGIELFIWWQWKSGLMKNLLLVKKHMFRR